METNSAAATTDIEDLPVVDVLVDVPGRHPAAAALGGVKHEGGAGEHQAPLQGEGCCHRLCIWVLSSRVDFVSFKIYLTFVIMS